MTTKGFVIEMFVCLLELNVHYNELQDVPVDTPELQGIFQLLDDKIKHTENIYTLSENAHIGFMALHDEVNGRKKGYTST